MALTKFKPQGPTKSGFEAFIDRHAKNGAPLIWPEGTDQEQVKAWRESGDTISTRKASLRPKGGKYYTRTTNYIDVVDDKEVLSEWKQKAVLAGAAIDPSIVRRVQALDDPMSPDNRATMLAIVEAAKDKAGANLKRDVGTALHQVLEDYDGGKPLGYVPEEFEAGIAEYVKHTQGIQFTDIESFGVQDDIEVAGTSDRFGIYRDELLVMDLKTTQTLDYSHGKHAMQLAIYARMCEYDPETFKRSARTHDGLEVSTSKGIIIHMPSGGKVCNLYLYNLDAGWERVMLAQTIRKDRNMWKTKAMAPTLIAGTDY